MGQNFVCILPGQPNHVKEDVTTRKENVKVKGHKEYTESHYAPTSGFSERTPITRPVNPLVPEDGLSCMHFCAKWCIPSKP